MTDENIRTDTVNFKDWVLGRGYFSEENLAKARKEFFTKMGKHWSELMLASMEKAFSDHDAVPEAKAAEPESSVPLGSVAAPANTHTLTEAEHDALEFAVETGRVAIHDDAILRKLLERLSHDAAPAARAAEPESSVPPGSVAAPANTHTLTEAEREA